MAIKRLTLDAAERTAGEYSVRLLREARVLQQVGHPNVVRCLDAGAEGSGGPLLVLEWLDGQDLTARQATAPLDLEQTAELARQTLDGLAACHAAGLAHRDIKPPNLFLVSSPAGPAGLQVKLIDFGIALLEQETSRLTQAGTVLGTLHYLSPEQARGSALIDHRTDLYSLGVVLYELTTGRLPFEAGSPAGVLFKIVAETPVSPRELRPELSEAFEAIILRAMRRAPTDRYASADEMRGALEGLKTGAGGAPGQLPATPRVRTTERRLVSLLCIQQPERSEDGERRAREAVERFGGVVQRLMDGRLIGVFGLEQTAGDETLRCLRAGLALQQADGPVRLYAAAVHVETGRGVIIDAEDLDRTVAQMDALPRGALYVDRATRDLATGKLQIEQAGELHVVVGLDPEAGGRAILGARPPVVGRDSELAALNARLKRVVEGGDPEAALLFGPPGIGKSRLLGEVLPGLRERAVLCLEARPDSTRSETPYSLLADALRRKAGVQVGQDEEAHLAALQNLVFPLTGEPLGREILPFIGEAVGVFFPEATALRVARSDPSVMQQQTTRAFEELIRAAGRVGLIVLCLDDLQWSDEESLRLCEHLLLELEGTPLFVLATCRPELLERHPDLFTAVEGLQLEVQPLGRRSLRRLIRAILGTEVVQEVDALVGAQWDGNPYFAEELISWMVRGEVLVRGEAGWEIQGDPTAMQIPASLQTAIQARLDGLEADLKELIKTAAVFGETLWEDGCEALGFPEARLQLEQLRQAEMLEPAGESRFAATRQWRFRHALLQQTAYEMLLHDQRRRLHGEVAGWLEGMGEHDAAVLARHFQLGGEDRRAAKHFGRAGACALAEGQLAGAVRFFGQSLALEPEPARRLEQTLELARAQYLLGQYDEGLELIAGLQRRLDASDELQRARSAWLRGRLLFALAEFDRAEEILRQAASDLAAAPQQDPELTFGVDLALFWDIWAQGRYGEARIIADALNQAARNHNLPEQLCAAKLAVAYCNVLDGDLSLSVRLAQEATEHARAMGHPYREVDSLLLLSSAREVVGLYEEASHSLAAAAQLAARLGTTNHLANIEMSLGRIHLLRGELAAALERYRSAERLAESIGDRRIRAIALVGQAQALYQGSDLTSGPQSAEALTRKALESIVGRAPPVEAEALAARAQLALAGDDAVGAVKDALAAVDLVDQLGGQAQCEVEILLAAYDALEAGGRGDEARAMLERARALIDRRATLISDDAVRDSFLGCVPHHVRVLQLARA